MISIEQIFKSYGELKVLKGISMQVQKGEIVSITGPSGAGKSTLLHIAGTLDKADSGTVSVNNQLLNGLTSKKLAVFRNRHIGFVFQFHHLLPEFTALENVCIPAYIAKKSKIEAEKRALELFGYLGLSQRKDHKPSELSGGERQRVAVARALINSPAVVLADEPSGNLDSENRNELHELLFRLRDDFGQTFIIVTHDDGFADRSDRIFHIKDGILA